MIRTAPALACASTLAIASGSASGAGLDLSLGNETANLQLLLNPRQLYESGGTELSLGAFVNEPGDLLLNATLVASGLTQTATSQYQLGVGAKLIGGDIEAERDDGGAEDQTLGALGLGFQFGVLVAQSPRHPVDASIEAFYAPEITSFSDAENFYEIAARLQVDIIPQAQAYVGYRRMEADTDLADGIELDDSAHVGFRIRF